MGAKRALRECSGEVGEAKKKRVNANAAQNATSSARQIHPFMRGISILEDQIEARGAR